MHVFRSPSSTIHFFLSGIFPLSLKQVNVPLMDPQRAELKCIELSLDNLFHDTRMSLCILNPCSTAAVCKGTDTANILSLTRFGKSAECCPASKFQI